MKYLKLILVGVVLSVLVFSMHRQVNQQDIVSGKDPILPYPSTFTIDASIYYMTGDAMLEPEAKTLVISGNRLVEAVIAALQEKPSDSQHFQVVASDVKVLSSEIVNQKLYINLNQAFTNTPFWDRGYRELVVYSLVNSLTQFDNINRIQLRVDGVDVDQLMTGPSDYSDLTFNDAIVYRQPVSPEDFVVNFLNLVRLQRYDLAYDMVESSGSLDLEAFTAEMSKYDNEKKSYTAAQPFSKRDGDIISVYITYQYYDTVRNVTYDGGTEMWQLRQQTNGDYRIVWPRVVK